MKINLDEELTKILDDYNEHAVDVLNSAIDESAKEARDELKVSGDFKDRTGKYRKGWSVKSGSRFMGVESKTVHNKPKYQLTHLLEYGHVNRDGSRTRAFPHIAKVEAESAKNFERKVREKL